MHNILYILGAGFSAPLGIPTISNFMEKAKDMLQREPAKYEHFNVILNKIKLMGHAKNRIYCDLDNLEEVLSILDMDAFTSGEDYSSHFTRLIRDVITLYTPPFRATNTPGVEWYSTLFGRDNNCQLYFEYLSLLLNLKFISSGNGIHCTQRNDSEYRFAIITLNYDLVIESVVDEINRGLKPEKPIKCLYSSECTDDSFQPDYALKIAKLHGTLPNNIVPPTWNKVRKTEIEGAWRMGRRLISEANHIVIIGYSMPDTDAYFRYLLINGLIHERNLKSVYIINNDNRMRDHYHHVFYPDRCVFAGTNTTDYLKLFSLRSDSTTSVVSPCRDLPMERIIGYKNK